MLLLASAVIVTFCYNAAVIRATNPADSTSKENLPTASGYASGYARDVLTSDTDKRGSLGYVGNRFSPIGPSYSLAYPQLYADYISEMLRPRKRAGFYDAYYDPDYADPYVIKKEMPGVLRFGKRVSESLQEKRQSAVPGVLRFGKRSEHGDMPGVLRFGKRDDIPGVLRFGKRDADMPGVLRFGKRDADMPGVLRFGKREDSMDMPDVLRFGKRELDGGMPGVLRFGKRDSAEMPGVLRFGKRDDIPGVLRFG